MKFIFNNAKTEYSNPEVLKKYMEVIEEIISLPILIERLDEVRRADKGKSVLDDLILYYKVEFNVD